MPSQTKVQDSPTAWFAMLEKARLTNDDELADRAYAELERLGVIVVFRRHGGDVVESNRQGTLLRASDV